MKRLIQELRRREVFRTTGLYAGIAWIVIEASSIALPTFDAPAWTMRAIIICAVIGFPIMLVLTWIYDITDHGIVVQADASDDEIAPFGSRKADFVVIGVLSVALIFSVYLNFSSGPAVEVELPPVSVLLADFDNQTGDPLFDNSLEQALSIGLEGASFVTAYNRISAARLLESLNPGSTLDEAGARLISIREGIKLVVAGMVSADGDGYRLAARMVNPEDGAIIAESSVLAKDKIGVLAAVSTLADNIREELGDESVNDDARPIGETFTAASLDAVKHYTEGQDLAAAARYDEALPFYEMAVKEDPNFGRAYSGWALTLFYLGREEEAKALWEQALSRMDTMTERERYRTLGLYYVAVAGDFPKAVESYTALVEKYPADNTGYNNMAISYYFMLDFDKAMEAAGHGLEIYPNNKTVISNFALFAMLAGEFDKGAEHASGLLAEDPGMWKAWLPIAMQKLASNDIDAARQAYDRMAQADARGAAFANLGLADIAIFVGQFAEAAELLEAGIRDEAASGNKRLLGRKYIALAEARQKLGDAAAARDALQKGLAENEGNGQLVPAALISLELGDAEFAASIADRLGQELQPNARSFGQVIRGAIASAAGRHADAIDALRSGVTLMDSWLLRFYLGRAYFEAGRYVEAVDEFELCLARRGEATALFLDDDEPTWRYMAPLQEWLAKARDRLGAN
ncbi:MAG: hypothetical protein OEV69_07095 [Gammaproteobacteria bacterium]|nr:hypothetical protein [Gammaproteobacteria bacterium]